MENHFDIIVIGAGPGGYHAAIRAAQNGLSAALIESRDVGGTCLNRGCIPTKSLLHSAGLFNEAKNMEHAGITTQGVSYDLEKIHEFKNGIVEKLRSGVETLVKANKIELIRGAAKITAPTCVDVTQDVATLSLTADKIIIATGSVPGLPPIEGIETPGVLTSDDMLSLTKPLNKLIIIGGGVIGVEFASIYNFLGCDVTIIEASERIISQMDKEISQSLSMILKKRGVKIFTSATVNKIEGGVTCHFTQKGAELSESGEAVLVSVGRKANIDGLFDETLGLTLERGRIAVDSNYQTNIPGIYAIGDAIGGIQLAHAASAHASLAIDHIAGKPPSVNINTIPGCIYTNPEIATVGISADDAKKEGLAVKVGKFSMLSNARSMIENLDRGVIKVVICSETNKVLGAQMICGRATDLIGEAALAVANEMTLSQLTKTVHAHPTFAEAIFEACENAEGHGVHTITR